MIPQLYSAAPPALVPAVASNPARRIALRAVEMLLPALIGFLVFAGLLRMGVMRPWELQWLGAGDGAQHLVGLHYFVQEPWRFPPAMLSTYGDGVPTSVVYTDSVPLLALPWKAALRALGITSILQPFGVFVAVGFALQGVFGYRVLRQLTGCRGLALLGTPLIVLSPPMLQRLPGHFALASHWIILGALWLAIRPGEWTGRRQWAWLALLGAALGIHFYLFCMAGVIYGAALLGGLLRGRLAPGRCGVYLAACAALVAGAGWLFGYFVPVDSQGGGYGEYKFNALGFFNPMEDWSRLFPSFRWAVGGEYEGFAWFGTGLVALGLASCFLPLERGADRLRVWKQPLLVAGLTLLLAGAMTASVNLGPLPRVASLMVAALAGLLLLAWGASGRGAVTPGGMARRWLGAPVPALALMLTLAMGIAALGLPFVPAKLLEIARSSGRMAWPLYYWLVCWIIARVILRFPKPVAAALLAAAIGLQVFDMAPKMRTKRHDDFKKGGLTQASCALPSAAMTDALWRGAEGKKRLWIVMSDRAPREGDRLGLLAIQKGLFINRPWVARYPQELEQRREEEITGHLDRAEIPADALYYVYPDARVHASAAIEGNPGGVEFVEENGFTVLTRAAHPSPELARENLARWRRATPCLPVRSGAPLRFTTGGEAAAQPGAVSGFSDFSKSGAWTDQNAACINLRAPRPGSAVRLVFTLRPFLNPRTSPGQLVRLAVNGEPVGEWVFTEGGETRREMMIPGRLVPEDGILSLRLEPVNAVSPKSLGSSPDARRLGIHLVSVEPYF